VPLGRNRRVNHHVDYSKFGVMIEEEKSVIPYIRMYTDDDGETHFSDELLSTTVVPFAPPAPPFEVTSGTQVDNFVILRGPPGWFDDGHPAPRRMWVIGVQGEVVFQVSDGEERTIGPGSMLLAEDTTGKGHKARVVGEEHVILAVVQIPMQA
jgi:hypothetical protein